MAVGGGDCPAPGQRKKSLFVASSVYKWENGYKKRIVRVRRGWGARQVVLEQQEYGWLCNFSKCVAPLRMTCLSSCGCGCCLADGEWMWRAGLGRGRLWAEMPGVLVISKRCWSCWLIPANLLSILPPLVPRQGHRAYWSSRTGLLSICFQRPSLHISPLWLLSLPRSTKEADLSNAISSNFNLMT